MAADRVGQQLGNYQLTQLIGRGTASEVYLGEHVELGNQVAIKFLRVNLATPADMDQFRVRSRMLIELVHPSIVRVLDSGLDQGTAYLVMDYAPNGTLRQRYPRGSQLKLSTVVPLIQQITAGLRYAHRARLVHQGISPEHLLLGRHDELLISDFDNAILSDNPQKRPQQMSGRVTYMAPEQLRGEAVPESDQYALGIMAYEWLTGAPPFQGSWREVAHQHALIPPLPLHEKLPGISRGVEEVILTALAKEPGQRFPSVQAFTAYLTHASNEALDMFTMTFPAEMPSSAFLWQVTSPEISSMMRAISAPLKALPPPPEADRPPISGPVKPGSGPMRPSQQEALEILKEPPLHVGAADSAQITIERPPSNGPAHMPSPPGRSSPVPTSDVPGTNGHIVVKKSYRRDVLRMTIALLVIALIGGMELFGFLGKGPFSFMSPHPAQAIPSSSTRSSAGARTPVPSATPAVRITAFALPTGSVGPLDITVGPDGALWFTEPQGNRIGRMTPQGTVTEFPLPNANSQPTAIVKGPDGNLWFTEQQGNQIGSITPQGNISEFPLPIANSQPLGIVAAPDGNLWFTELISNRIGRITPDGSFLDGFALPNDNSQPAGITVGPDGNLWFTEQQGNQIGRLAADGTISEFPAPTANSKPDAITAGLDGALWFTEQQGNHIGSITPQGNISEFPLPIANSQPLGIVAAPDGNLWFTELISNRIGRIAPDGSFLDGFALPNDNSQPAGITVGPDGNLWFTEQQGNQIGSITPQGNISEFPAPTANSKPDAITAGPDGNLWFTEQQGNRIGRITPDGAVTEFPLPKPNCQPGAIVTGPDGNLWFTEQQGNQIGRITPQGIITGYSVPTPNSQPDAIIVGPDGALWFTEQQGNQIGRLISGR